MRNQRVLVVCICFILFIHFFQGPFISTTLLGSPIESIDGIEKIEDSRKYWNVKPILNTIFSQINLPADADDTSFEPRNLNFSDDAYHNSTKNYATEWWYFDTTFNQDYSLQFGIHIYEVLSTGFAQIQCHIYEKGKKLISETSIQPLSKIDLSLDQPLIKLNDQIIMRTRNSSSDNAMLYQINYTGTNYSFNLSFQGTTMGWKGTTSAGDWAVVLPKAIVTGEIMINDESQIVFGIGYHDHNWNVSLSTGLNFGWLWGKTNIDQYTLTWANIFKTWYKKDPLLVINEDYDGFYNVLEDDIDFIITKIEFKNGLITPYGFLLSVHTNEIELSVSIEVLQTDYISVLGLINYWRYHTHATGYLKIDDKTMDINDYNIAEFMRLRPY